MLLKAEYIKALCLAKGWSQNELARRACISKGTMSKALAGRRVGRKVISGLLRIFPNENINNLTVT